MKKLVVYLVVLSGLAFVTSCGDDGATPGSTEKSTGKLKDADKAKLYDKVWFSTSQGGGIDHEFLSDGTLRQSQSLDGRWVWENNGDTMNIVDYQGARYSYLFQTITASSMSFKTSVDGYKNVFTFKDTE
ncbi:MAG: hypothetical protein JJ975_09250 [Bacteroidia bacterium]|nr:hypothetical protein [Bacteroidia bacterium]